MAASIITLTVAAQTFAQNPMPAPRWHIEPQTFFACYDESFGYAVSRGAGVAVGRRGRDNLHLLVGSAYHVAVQPLVLFGNEQKMKSDWLRVYGALRKDWRLARKPDFALFVEAEAAMLYIRARALQIFGGAPGTIALRSKSEIKFSPALGTGLRVRVWPRWEVLCYVKKHFMTWGERRLENATAKPAWKAYWHLGAGLSYSFE